MKSLISYITVILIFCYQVLAQQNNSSNSNYSTVNILSNTVIIKVKSSYRNFCSNDRINISRLEQVFNSLQVIQVQKKFPSHKAPFTKTNKLGMPLADLSLIYEIKYLSNTNISKAISILKSSNVLEYAEPHIIPQLCFTPNDPLLANQYYILDSTRMRLREAWDITMGDTNVVIGITDTGADINQEDLRDNIKYNYLDPINGIDDDQDAYTDNFRGWDLGDMDNNPQDVGVHGSHVSGISSASVNNAKGIAGVGFKCKFLPVKIANSSGVLTMAYEGIVYAADHGAHIINCSWGSTTGSGQYGQDIINYATINQNSLVIAAAGNNNTEDKFYPAAYEYVLSVANVNSTDAKFTTSSFGSFIDISGPGTGIQSTFPNNSYNYSSGTSMASPVIAGCAGLVKSKFPSLNALQLAQQLRATSDNIILANPNYIDKLGSGRVNMFRALTETNKPSFDIYRKRFYDNNNNSFDAGDTIRLIATFINFLAPSVNAIATLTTVSPHAFVVNDLLSLGSVGTLDSVRNINNPFSIKLLNSVPINHELPLKITFTEGGQEIGFVCFNIPVNNDFYNYNINEISSTATSNGLIGYNNFIHSTGQGFIYRGQNLLYECGLMIGNSTTKVSDNIRNSNRGDQDFARINKIEVQQTTISDLDLLSVFNDDSALANKMSVRVLNNTHMWNDEGHQKYIISEYVIHNNSSQTLSSLYAGLFADWDIMNAVQNKADYDAAKKMGYTYSTQMQGLYSGIMALSHLNNVNCYSIDNTSGGGGGLDITSNYSTSLKFQTLSQNRFIAGNVNSNGNDVCQVLSNGPFSIAPNDSIVVAYALLAGDNMSDLKLSADSALAKYQSINNPTGITNIEIENIKIFPNPFSNKIFITTPFNQTYDLIVYNNLGQIIFNSYNSKMIDTEKWASGIYHLLIRDNGLKVFKYKIIKQ